MQGRNLLYAVLFLFISSLSAHAQLYKGRVINAVTKNAVTGVTVTLGSTGAAALTDTAGSFIFWDATGSAADRMMHPAPVAPALSGGAVFIRPGKDARVAVYSACGNAVPAAIGASGRLSLPAEDGMRYLVLQQAGRAAVYRMLSCAGAVLSLSSAAAIENGSGILARSTAAAAAGTLTVSRAGYISASYPLSGPADTLELMIEREYGIPVFSDFTGAEINRGYFPYVDSETWQISTYCCGTGRNHFMLENCVFTDTVTGDSGTGYLHMTVQANTTNGAEIWSTMKTHYGFYETRMKTADIAGACNAFFLQDWNNGHIGEEVDLEFLTGDYDGAAGTGNVHCQLHPGNYGGSQALPFNPGEGFHRYGWIWMPDTLKWLADGEVIQTITDTSIIPDGFVQMVYNNWTGNPNWGGGPPVEDNTMIIDWCRYYPDADTVVPLEY